MFRTATMRKGAILKLGVIADDFTGASDIGLTLAEGGMRVTQFIGVPTISEQVDIDVGVVALKSRTAPVAQAVAESCQACDWLLAQGAEQIVLKICSTFDSKPEGNIGPVLEALAERLGETTILVCPAFPENGRSVYQGHLFVEDRLLSESGMQDHPLTPMTDADLRRVLGAQTSWDIGHVPIRRVQSGAQAVLENLPSGRSMVIVDAIQDADLLAIGAVAKSRKLLCGGSGIGIGLPANFGATPHPPSWAPLPGAGVVLSGSCSRATRAQVAHYRASSPAFEVSVEAVMSGETTAEMLANWVAAQTGVPMVYSSADPDAVRAAQTKFGSAVVAARIEDTFAKLAEILAGRGTARFVVAGGETSGAVTTGLGATALEIGPRIAPGVPVVRLKDRPLALALKSGNFGDTQFFETALDVMEGQA